jgi:hypothetical protein
MVAITAGAAAARERPTVTQIGPKLAQSMLQVPWIWALLLRHQKPQWITTPDLLPCGAGGCPVVQVLVLNRLLNLIHACLNTCVSAPCACHQQGAWSKVSTALPAYRNNPMAVRVSLSSGIGAAAACWHTAMVGWRSSHTALNMCKHTARSSQGRQPPGGGDVCMWKAWFEWAVHATLFVWPVAK